MDLATLIGLVGGFGVIIGAILTGGSLTTFIDVPSVIIVVGGTVCSVLMQFPIGKFFGAIGIAMRAFFGKSDPPEQLIEEAIELSNTARKSGLLALEGVEINNEFLKNGIQMAVDGHPPEFVSRALSKDINLTIERHETGQSIFKAMGDAAPAMGMIGTLIGLVLMLSNMSDPKSIGPSMAVALLTTLYGAVIANAVAIPIANKLEMKTKEERLSKSLILETIAGIQEGLNPRVMETLLQTYLPGKKRSSGDEKDAA